MKLKRVNGAKEINLDNCSISLMEAAVCSQASFADLKDTVKCEPLLPPVGSLGSGFCYVFWLLDGVLSSAYCSGVQNDTEVDQRGSSQSRRTPAGAALGLKGSSDPSLGQPRLVTLGQSGFCVETRKGNQSPNHVNAEENYSPSFLTPANLGLRLMFICRYSPPPLFCMPSESSSRAPKRLFCKAPERAGYVEPAQATSGADMLQQC
ncbi:unnamed protein product [Leuciscus chuanchicus]